MVKVTVNDYKFVCSQKITLLNLCRLCGLNDYKFCYHENLPIAGNCRICLIEIEDMDKQVAACVTNIEPNVSIWTDNVFCKKARENVIETLLINHPLDCPICDQGGDCDLQDQVRVIGGFKSRFFFNKRAIKDKNTGLFIKTIMTRCIHCLRCVRFNKLIGERIFGVLNRTNKSEIVYHSFDNNNFDFRGVTVDLCPVGALTSRSYSFKCRPWELKMVEGLDITDNLGSNLYINYKDSEIFRITPKTNFYINGNIISDKIRFSLDANNFNRLKVIYKQDILNYKRINWANFLADLKTILKTYDINFIINGSIDLDTMFYLKKLSYQHCEKIKVFNISTVQFTNLHLFSFSNFLFDLNTSNDACFLIGTQPQIESSVLNLKLRLKYKKSLISIFSLGRFFFETYQTSFLNLNIKKILNLLESKLKRISYDFAFFNSIILFYNRSFYKNIFQLDLWSNIIRQKLFNFKSIEISINSNIEGLRMSNILHLINNKLNGVLCCINLEDNLKIRHIISTNYNNVFWFNTHKPLHSFLYKYIIPVSTIFESENYFINIENRVQKTQQITNFVPSVYNLLQSIFCVNLNKIKFSYYYLSFLLELIVNFNRNLVVFYPFENMNNFFYNYCDITVIKCLILKTSIENNFSSNTWTKNSNSLLQAYSLRKKKYKLFSYTTTHKCSSLLFYFF